MLGLVLVAGIYLALNAAAFFVVVLRNGIETADRIAISVAVGSTPTTALSLLATFAPLALGVVIAARVLQKRGPATLFGPIDIAVRDFLRSCLVSLLVFGTLSAIGLLFMETDPYLPVGIWFAVLPLSLIVIAIQTLAEELLFRSYLQQQLAARFAYRAVWMVLPALLFGLLHINPENPGTNIFIPVGFAFVFGLIATDLTARTGSIGAAWGVHFVINVFGLTVVGASGTINGLVLRTIPKEDLAESLTPILVVTDIMPLVLAWLILRRVLRR